jgi:hypothetical protein
MKPTVASHDQPDERLVERCDIEHLLGAPPAAYVTGAGARSASTPLAYVQLPLEVVSEHRSLYRHLNDSKERK